MEFSYRTPPHRASGCEMLALWTDLWMKTLLSVQSAHPLWGWVSLTQGRQGVWPGVGCAPPAPPQPGMMLVGMPRGFLLGCAIPDTFLPSMLWLWDPAQVRCEQGSSRVTRFAAWPLAGRPELFRQQHGAGVNKRRQGGRLGCAVQGW